MEDKIFEKPLYAFLLFVLFSLIAVFLFPFLDNTIMRGIVPSNITFLGTGVSLIIATGALLLFGIKLQTNLSRKFLLFAFLYNSLIIATKFTLAPAALYAANQRTEFTGGIVGAMFTDSGSGSIFGVGITTAIIFVLYFIVFLILKSYFLASVKRDIAVTADASMQSKKGRSAKLVLLFALLVGGAVLVATGLYGILVVPLILAQGAIQYITYIQMSGIGVFIALALVGAVVFATAAFKDAAEQAKFTRNITVLATFIWLGGALLLTYHILWMIYFLLIASIWPLKVVVPK